MDPRNAAEMAGNIARALPRRSGPRGDLPLQPVPHGRLPVLLVREPGGAAHWDEGPEITGLVTFHDGFQYFARAYGLPLLAAIEEEAGSEASAKEIVEITVWSRRRTSR